MDFQQLKAFISVVDHRSISRAAEDLYCSQSGISTKLKKLEEELGTVLIDRTTRPFVLTEAGEILYRHAKKLRKIQQNFLEEMERCQNREVHFGASSVPAIHLLPPIICEYCRRFPDFRFSMEKHDSAEVIRLVDEGVLDFGVVGTKTDISGCCFTPVCEDRIVLALPLDERFKGIRSDNLSQLTKLPLILREEGSGTLQESRRLLHSIGLDLDSCPAAARLSDAEMIVRFVTQGLGASFLSYWVVREAAEKGLLRIVSLPSESSRPFYMLSKNEALLGQGASALMQYLTEQLRKISL